MLNVACFVQSCLTDADFVIFLNYCLIGTRLKPSFLFVDFKLYNLLRRCLCGIERCIHIDFFRSHQRVMQSSSTGIRQRDGL